MQILFWILFVIAVYGESSVAADEVRGSFRTGVVLDALDNPCGMALRPPSNAELFFAESGAGRVVRVPLIKPSDRATAIHGFAREDFGGGPKYQIGPLAVAFLDRTTLVVGEGGQKTGTDVVRVFQLPEDGKHLAFDQSKQVLRPVAVNGDVLASEGDFFAIAATPATVFAASNGDDATGWVFKANVVNATASQLKPFVATKRETGVNAPTVMAISKRGELVVAHAGELAAQNDGMLSFYHATTGKRLLKLETGLRDVTGLAYARSGLLYAVDFSWAEPSTGGLFRLDMELRGGRQAIKPVKLLALDHPAGLVIASERVMYVTTFGMRSEADDSSRKTGQLLKIEKIDGDL